MILLTYVFTTATCPDSNAEDTGHGREETDTLIPGDFEGSVTGTWVRFAENGGGIVKYNNKKYMTKPIGFASIPPGTEVELSHANGVYFSKF